MDEYLKYLECILFVYVSHVAIPKVFDSARLDNDMLILDGSMYSIRQ